MNTAHPAMIGLILAAGLPLVVLLWAILWPTDSTDEPDEHDSQE